ncbi:MAG: hypothetical protein KDD44_14100, partial [Bdellovibrionales bacterium]|nr:hypothetical protein [Bdellovibrionales bacterium]
MKRLLGGLSRPSSARGEQTVRRREGKKAHPKLPNRSASTATDENTREQRRSKRHAVSPASAKGIARGAAETKTLAPIRERAPDASPKPPQQKKPASPPEPSEVTKPQTATPEPVAATPRDGEVKTPVEPPRPHPIATAPNIAPVETAAPDLLRSEPAAAAPQPSAPPEPIPAAHSIDSPPNETEESETTRADGELKLREQSMQFAAPIIMDLDTEDEESLVAALDDLIGDMEFDVEAVKVKEKIDRCLTNQLSGELAIDDDLDVDFDIEVQTAADSDDNLAAEEEDGTICFTPEEAMAAGEDD